jgi:transposase
MRLWCGIDWAQRHHDIAVVDDDGVLVVKRRIEDSAAGFRQLLELLAEHAQRSEAPIPIAMETAKGADLGQALGEAFAQHPDAVIITSFPGLGTVLGARILGEIGDDRARFADAKALKAFAGTAPVTRASGLPGFRA